VWVAAATAVAVVALIEAEDAKERQSTTANATQEDIQRVRTRLQAQIERLRAAVERLPTQSELDQLRTRVRNAARDANRASNAGESNSQDIRRLTRRVDDLEQQVDQLEQQGNAGGE
jgi:predicted RNase H-like nuclease (RuvC/YqgF family)